MTQFQFRTHTGEIIQGEKLQSALNKVADNWQRVAVQSDFPPHVTPEVVAEWNKRNFETAEKIRAGKIDNFTLWQRVNTELTGECVALLPSNKRKENHAS